MSSVVCEGDQVIIKKGNVLKVFHIRQGRKFWMERIKFGSEDLVGQKYGTSFEFKNGRLEIATTPQESKDGGNCSENGGDIAMRDNRSLTDTGDNQKLTKEGIQDLRHQGVTGEDIVEQLVENSATFKKKTDFSQEKYIRKKTKKYVPVIRVLRPTTRLLAEMYYSKGPLRICNLRPDSLAQVLSLGNVRSGNNMLVVESCVGLVVAAMLHRMSGRGHLVHIFSGSAPVHQAVEAYNFSKEQLSILHSFPLDKVASLRKKNTASHSHEIHPEVSQSPPADSLSLGSGDVDQTESGSGETDCGMTTEESVEDSDVQDNMMAGGSEETSQQQEERILKRAKREERLESVRSIIRQNSMDGLIVASKYHPTPIALRLLEFVAPGRPIVIFSQYKEPLLDCFTQLRSRRDVLLLKLTETWLREYQVLPNRTHPSVNMSAGGGYILTGTTVCK